MHRKMIRTAFQIIGGQRCLGFSPYIFIEPVVEATLAGSTALLHASDSNFEALVILTNVFSSTAN
jgi:hypothetical protein